MGRLWITVSVPAESKDWSLLKLQHTGLCSFPWRQTACPRSGLDSCPAAERNNRTLVALLAWCAGQTGKLWAFLHGFMERRNLNAHHHYPTLMVMEKPQQSSFCLHLEVRGVQCCVSQLVSVVWVSCQFHFLLHCCVLWDGTERRPHGACCWCGWPQGYDYYYRGNSVYLQLLLTEMWGCCLGVVLECSGLLTWLLPSRVGTLVTDEWEWP